MRIISKHHFSCLFLCCILFFIPNNTCAKHNQPFVKVGTVKKEFTDAACTLKYRKKFIFIDSYADNEFCVNLNGQDVQLTPAGKIDEDSYQYQANGLAVVVDYGPGTETPPPGKWGMDGTLYKKAQITFSKDGKVYRLKAEGACF